MNDSPFDRIEAARLLRELAADLLEAEGPARNGLFLELHRLHDTIFRLVLESHPDAAPELAAQAFATVDSLPAPQVARELYRLDPALVTSEIYNLYKHMNVARNNMAHNPQLGRQTISRANSKRMAYLARLVAAQLDPSPDAGASPGAPSSGDAPRHFPLARLLLWSSGACAGLAPAALWGDISPLAVLLLILAAILLAYLAWRLE